ncbi:hypothetical protein [Verminephrobacter aporrectodeae]|uniref:hypothetical protein n=1 Tax=Verminephrobacter aporrectodeae TaxID=1110389 RepID=UPI002242FB6E|nr:hypothetical protein [Verminephrobacter aporrectodeae]
MNIPRLEIYLSQSEGLCISNVEKQNSDVILCANVSLNELKSYGSENSANRIGEIVLSTLKCWHKQEFRNLKICKDEGYKHYHFYKFALRLVSHAFSEKTVAHNAAIEFFLQEAAISIEDARKYLKETWPLLQHQLENS